MEEKFKLNETLEDLKKDETYWPMLQLMVVTAIRSEEKDRDRAGLIEDMKGSESCGLTDMVGITTYVKTFSWMQYTLLSKNFHGQIFSKEEFLEALVYNRKLYQDIVVEVLSNKDVLVDAVLAILNKRKVDVE